MQVVQQSPTLPAGTLNTTFQGLLKGTPWAYYQLISTQWQGGSGPPTKPAQLGNPLLETFVSIRTRTVVWIVTTSRTTHREEKNRISVLRSMRSSDVV